MRILMSEIDRVFIQRVLEYTERQPGSGVREMAELAPGMVAVCDVSQQMDIYFDREKWGAARPNDWGDELYPPGLQGTGIGVLENPRKFPRGLDLKYARWYAEDVLKTVASDSFHSNPEMVTIDDLLLGN